MSTTFQKLLAVGLTLIGCSPPGKGTLSFVPPAGWKVEHTRSRGLHSYRIAEPKRLGGLLEFSQWPVPGNKAEDIPRIVEEVTSNFLRQARVSTEFTLASEKYNIEQFVGEQCQGSFVTFEMAGYNTNMVQAIFVMSVGGKLWNGQFSGSLDTWKQALTVLRGVKNG